MKNTLVVSNKVAAETYREQMMEHLYCDMHHMDVREFASDLERLAEDLKGMLTNHQNTAHLTFKRLFKNGSTMMIVPIDDFQELERWSTSNEEFQIVIVREDGTAIGVVQSVDVMW
jgi:signal-transduction protein with cAMP-binding, CBS, and nucleotidyltransferase domain